MKILIVGIVASGKTTFTKKLSQLLNIAYHELDNIAHNSEIEGRPKRTGKEQMAMISNICKKEQWIFEGVYRESHKELYSMADTIIYLNMPLRLRKRRIITRFIKQQLRIEKSHYRSDLRMLKFMFKWTRDFEINRQTYEEFLSGFGDKVIYLKSPKAVKAWLKKIKYQGRDFID